MFYIFNLICLLLIYADAERIQGHNERHCRTIAYHISDLIVPDYINLEDINDLSNFLTLDRVLSFYFDKNDELLKSVRDYPKLKSFIRKC